MSSRALSWFHILQLCILSPQTLKILCSHLFSCFCMLPLLYIAVRYLPLFSGAQQGPAPHCVSACISRSLRLNMGLYQCTGRAVGMEVTQVHELIVAIMILFSKAPQVPLEEHERDSVFNTTQCSSCKFTCPTPNKWVKKIYAVLPRLFVFYILTNHKGFHFRQII